MTVTAPRADSCIICGQPRTSPTRQFATAYCSSACKQRAYRHRVNERRLQRSAERRKSDAEQHRNEWCRFLMDSASMSRKQAERAYTALMSIDRLVGPPYEQMTFSDG